MTKAKQRDERSARLAAEDGVIHYLVQRVENLSCTKSLGPLWRRLECAFP